MTSIYQTPDKPGDDPVFAAFWAYAGVLSSGQFVIIRCAASERVYLGQVASPQLNINRDALGPTDNTTINQIEAVASGKMERHVTVREVFWHKVRLLKDVTEGTPRSVRQRSQILSEGRAATADEIVRFLGLPKIDEAMRVGTLIDTDIPACISMRTLMHHMLVAGSTGSGKSNTMANVITSALEAGACVLLYDHKPDYQNVHEANDEGSQSFFRGLPDVAYWRLGNARGNALEREIMVPASELDPSVLAATICHQPSEYNQAETLDTLLWRYSDERRDDAWSIADFLDWLPKNAKACGDELGLEIDQKTFNAMKNKLHRRGRLPHWVDGRTSPASRQMFGSGTFDLASLIKPGRAIVVRIDGSAGNGRGYGLFLSYILKEAYRLKESGAVALPILHAIDEAQDIFSAGRTLQAAVGGMLDDNIRKGRSRGIGFVIGVQSADAVPEQIRNNLNSQLIHRHNNHAQAKEAMTRASPEQLAMTDTFGPGECLAYLFGANAVIHAQMRQSPFKLTKEGA